MRFLRAAIVKDLRRRLADPAAQLTWIGLPVIFGGLMSLVAGDNGPAPKAHLLVVDEDRSFVSGLVGMAGRQGQTAQFLQIEEVNAVEGNEQIQAGKASALLIIPKGFQDGVLREQPTALTLVSGDAAMAAKALRDFRRATQLLEFKGGWMNGAPLSPTEIDAIAQVPAG